MSRQFPDWAIGWLGLLLWVLSLPLARSAVPEPIARWTFEADARDSVGSMHGELLGDATIANGRLVLHGNGFVRTAPLTSDLAARTLVARVKVESVAQWGGGVMAVQTTNAAFSFEKLAFNSGGYWEVGSQGITKGYYEAFAEVTPAFVHLALTFAADGTFVLYRNGRRHGEPFRPQAGLRTFGKGAALILFGWPGNLRGEIEEAALYDRTLTAAEVAELAGVSPVDDQEQVMLGFATSELVMEESTIGSIVVHRTGRLDQPVSATLELRAGSAEVTGEGADLFIMGQNPAVLTFQPGQTEMAVQIRAQLDLRDEAPESASLLLTKAGSATVQGGLATITVIPWINRVRTGGLAAEIGQSHIYLELLTGIGGVVSVQTTSAGTATPGVDFVPVDREVSLTGSLSQRVVYVPLTVIRDGRIEGDETIGIRVTAVTDNTEVNPTDLLLTLQDEPVQIYPGVDPDQLLPSGQVAESTGVLRFILNRVGPMDSPDVFQVRYRFDGSADPDNGIAMARSGVDYVPTEGVVEFGPGVAQATVEVTLLNDTEADGPRGLMLQLQGSPQFPDLPNLASETGWATLADDERASLVQQADFSPFLLGNSASLSRGPDGRTRLVDATRVFELQSSGLPDLNFGGGTGRLSDPTGALTDWDRNRFSEPHRLADGRYLFLLPDRVVRWTARGEPDPTFGNGSGSISLPEPFFQLVHLAADGSLTLVTFKDWEGRRLRRFLPDGKPDPDFVVGEFQAPVIIGANDVLDISDVERTSSGYLWLLASPPAPNGALELRRLLPDGRPDPAFLPRAGVTRSFGVDALDRAYFAVDANWTTTPGAGAPMALVRFLPDGRLDEGYRPARHEVTWVQGQVSPDGSLLGSTGGLEFLELNPAGEVVWQWQYPHAGAINPSANREPDGRVRVSADVERVECGQVFNQFFPPQCWTIGVTAQFRISKDGSSEEVYSSSRFRTEDLMDAAGIRWVHRSWIETPAAYERSLPVAIGSKAGLTRLTQMVLHGQSIRVPIQRAGTTADPATLRGRAFPWRNGNWDAESAVPFEVSLPTGVAETDIELNLPASADGALLVEWLVRLESASGTELSPLNESRLWVFTQAPEAGGLKQIFSAGPDTPNTLWLLRSTGSLQTTYDLSRTVWDTFSDDETAIWCCGSWRFPLGPNASVVGWDTASDPGPRFFRVVR